MAEHTLKVVKNNRQTGRVNRATARGAHKPGLKLHSGPGLTPAEAAEAARFRAMIAARAARQAMLHRIMSELQELDEVSPAA